MLLHRKFSNLPLELVTPLHANLADDLEWAIGGGSSGDSSRATSKSPGHLPAASASASASASTSMSTDSGTSSDAIAAEADEGEGDTAEYRHIDHLLLICNVTQNELSARISPGGALDVTGFSTSALLFDYFEDEIYHQQAACSVLFRSKLCPGPLAAVLVPCAALKRVCTEIQRLVE